MTRQCIAISSARSFKILKHSTDDKAGHGTRISTFVLRHLPDAAAMTDILSAMASVLIYLNIKVSSFPRNL